MVCNYRNVSRHGRNPAVVLLASWMVLFESAICQPLLGDFQRFGQFVEFSYSHDATVDSFLDDLGSVLNVGIVVGVPRAERLNRVPPCRLRLAEVLPFAHLVLRSHGLALVEMPAMHQSGMRWYQVSDVADSSRFNTVVDDTIKQPRTSAQAVGNESGRTTKIFKLRYRKAGQVSAVIARYIGHSVVTRKSQSPVDDSRISESLNRRADQARRVNEKAQILAGAQQRMMRLNSQSIRLASPVGPASQSKPDQVVAIDTLNWVVVTGYRDELERAAELVRQIDVPAAALVVRNRDTQGAMP